MPVDMVVGVAAVALSLPLLLWSLPGRDHGHRRSVANLRRGLDAGEEGNAGVRGPAGLALLGRRLLPRSTVDNLDTLLGRAGRPAGWSVDRLLTVKLALPVVTGLLGLLYLRLNPGLLPGLVVAVLVVVGFLLPELLLKGRGQERAQKIELELADLLDQVTIAVEAGLGFDAAIARAGRSRTSPLTEELMRTLQDIQVGQTRRQAYEALADRAGVPDLDRFIRSVLQADAYGVPIADVLRAQAGEVRLKRRQRAEETAMKIPTKVVFPLMLCILPVLFIVLLGPAAIDIIGNLS